MRLISDRVYSARLTAKVLLYQKMTFIFHEQLTFLNLPTPFLSSLIPLFVLTPVPFTLFGSPPNLVTDVL